MGHLTTVCEPPCGSLMRLSRPSRDTGARCDAVRDNRTLDSGWRGGSKREVTGIGAAGWWVGCARQNGNTRGLIARKPSVQIKKMKLVHACGPYGNDCGGPSSFSGKTVSLKSSLPTLRESPPPPACLAACSSQQPPEGANLRDALCLWRRHSKPLADSDTQLAASSPLPALHVCSRADGQQLVRTGAAGILRGRQPGVCLRPRQKPHINKSHRQPQTWGSGPTLLGAAASGTRRGGWHHTWQLRAPHTR